MKSFLPLPCCRTDCIKNFKITAGDITGEHKGQVFVDTDAYKWLEAVAYCLENGMALEYEWYLL